MKAHIRGFVGGVALLCMLPSASFAVDVTYTYDALGRLTNVSYGCGASTSYEYDAAGNRVSTAYVAPGSCPPTAVNDSLTAAFNTSSTFDPRTNDSDPVGYALAIASAAAPGHGVAVVNGGISITYTPTAGYSGADSFSYSISNGHGGSATATVTVTVAAAGNHVPVAVDDTASYSRLTSPGNPATATVTLDPRANDSDPDGDALTVIEVSAPTSGHAAVSILGGGTSVVYTYNTAMLTLITTDTFTYKISDGHGNTAIATVLVDIDIESNQ